MKTTESGNSKSIEFQCREVPKDGIRFTMHENGEFYINTWEEAYSASAYLDPEQIDALIEFLVEKAGEPELKDKSEESEVKNMDKSSELNDTVPTTFTNAINNFDSGYDIYCVLQNKVIKNPTEFTLEMINYGEWRMSLQTHTPKIYSGGRGSGKTVKMIEEARERKASILVMGNQMKKIVKDMSKEMDKEVHVFTISELMEGKLSGSSNINTKSKLFIDELDYILKYLLQNAGYKGTLLGYTTSAEIVKLPEVK